MMRKFLLAIVAVATMMSLPACTSGDSKDQEEVLAEDGSSGELEGLGEETAGEVASDAGPTDNETQTADTTLSLDSTGSDTAVAETANEEELTIDSFGESADATGGSSEPVPEVATMTEPEAPAPTETASADEIAPPTTMIDVAQQQETPEATTDLDETPKPAPKSLQKVAATPWKISGKWVNGIYFARPGDSLSSISQTIFGDDRSNELKKINPTYNNRDVKPGDKIYYASVLRPDDAEKVQTYFQEKNMPAKTYTAQEGDNIRKVSQRLLGYPEAWKEVWAYNSFDSKQGLDAGTEVRYWETNPASSAPSRPMADQAPSAPAEDPMPSTPELPPADVASNPAPDFPPPPEFPPPDLPAQDVAANDAGLPPPPPPMDIPPPPPPPMDIPPPPPQVAGQVDDGSGSASAEQDQMMMLGAVGVAAVGLLLFVVRRKRKQKELEQALGETHVG